MTSILTSKSGSVTGSHAAGKLLSSDFLPQTTANARAEKWSSCEEVVSGRPGRSERRDVSRDHLAV